MPSHPHPRRSAELLYSIPKQKKAVFFVEKTCVVHRVHLGLSLVLLAMMRSVLMNQQYIK